MLTAENLKSDLIDLWASKKTGTNGILIVTHNIEEAVFLADRIIYHGQQSGTIKKELILDMPHPRNDLSTGLDNPLIQIYTLMTTLPGDEITPARRAQKLQKIVLLRLPDVECMHYRVIRNTECARIC